MFDSPGIISKKGLLGSVWIAAHCLQRLKKKDVMETDIVACVDAILQGEAIELTYRILAYLLLGVVRIYSKQVEFLKRDFADMLHEAKNFKAGKEIRIIEFHNSIMIPTSFELDTFDLDILEDQDVSRLHIGSSEDITLADDSKGDIFCKNDKYHGQEYTFSYETFPLVNTPVRDVCSPWIMNIDSEIRSSYHNCILNSSLENRAGIHISLEKCLDQEMLGDIGKNPGFDMSPDVSYDGQQIMHHVAGISWEKSTNNDSVQPITLDDTGKESASNMVLYEGETDVEQMNCPDSDTNYKGATTMEELVVSEQSLEKLCQYGFPAVDHLKLVITDEVENGTPSAMPSVEGHQILGEPLKHPDTSINFESEENRLPPKISVGVTPNSKIAGGSAHAGSAEFMAIHTPTPKQRARVLRKQKCLLDDKFVISNKVLQDQLNDSSALVRKREFPPSTDLQAWRVQKRRNLPKTLFEPLIPCKGVDFIPLVSERKSKTRLSVKTAEIAVNPVILESPVTQMSAASAEAFVNPVVAESTFEQMCVEISRSPLDSVHVESPIIQNPLEIAEAPDTPILLESSATHISHLHTPVTPSPFTQSTSLRLHDVLGVPEPDILESISSCNDVEEQETLNKDKKSEIGWMDKEPTLLVSGNAEKCDWSAETWRAASYVHQNISNLKLHRQEDNEFLNLFQGLEKECRTVCAKLFYEILVLKTGDYIKVRQEDAYGDILVQEKPKLKQTLDAHDI